MTALHPFETGNANQTRSQKPLAGGSRFFQRLERRYAEVFATLPNEIPHREILKQAYAQLRGQGHEVGAALRVLRQWTMYRLLRLDCEEGAALKSEDSSTGMLRRLNS